MEFIELMESLPLADKENLKTSINFAVDFSELLIRHNKVEEANRIMKPIVDQMLVQQHNPIHMLENCD